MSSAPNSNAMPSQADNLSHDTRTNDPPVPSSDVRSVKPSASEVQDSSNQAAASLQGAGASTASAAASSKEPAAQATDAPTATSNTRDSTYDWVLKTESGLKDKPQVLWPVVQEAPG